jgi:hypothetical protein
MTARIVALAAAILVVPADACQRPGAAGRRAV